MRLARPKQPGALGWARWAYDSWATRSLAAGAMATALDVMVLLFCVLRLKWSNPAGAMAGVAVGATFAFFANRHFAFRDRHPPPLHRRAALRIDRTGPFPGRAVSAVRFGMLDKTRVERMPAQGP